MYNHPRSTVHLAVYPAIRSPSFVYSFFIR